MHPPTNSPTKTRARVFTVGVLLVVASFVGAAGQGIGAGAEVVTVHSQNGRFYLKSVQYDALFPSTRGRTRVYERGRAAPLYDFERGFDSVDEQSNNLVVSDDGEVVFYVIPWGADETVEGLKSVSVYRRGRLVRSYTEAEVNGCDERRERCELLYSNFEEVVDRAKSNWGTPRYRKAFKAGVGEQEKFLSDFAIFADGDTVYLTDSKRRTHVFDLKRDGALVRSEPFDALYEELKGRGRFNRVELEGYAAPTFTDFPRLVGGRAAAAALAARLGMKPLGTSAKSDAQFGRHTIKVSGYLTRGGRFEVERVEADEGVPRERVVEFFERNRFDARAIPREVEKWFIDEEYFTFRKADAAVARREKREQVARRREELKARMTAEKIGVVYVPKDLGESLSELDKLLPEVDRDEMRALPKREGMIHHHLGLGTWMRNNWGLWGGSRLQKYFTDRGVTHPEEMSTVILYHYHDWLNGKTETWRDWERTRRQ